jgi:hypothetical protein
MLAQSIRRTDSPHGRPWREQLLSRFHGPLDVTTKLVSATEVESNCVS